MARLRPLHLLYLASAFFLLLAVWASLRPLVLPPRQEAGVRLYGVELRLFPEEAGVEWRFRSPRMREEGGVFRLEAGLEGERWVRGRLDLRLWAPEVWVEPGDLLRAQEARLEILKGCYRLWLGEGVLLGEGEGIRAGRVRIEAPTLRGEARAFRSDFGLNRMDAETPRFEFPAEGRFGPCRVQGGEG